MVEVPEMPQRAEDSLRDCIGQLAERFGLPFRAGQLDSLALDREGRLPLHQAEAALDLVGLNADVFRPGKLPIQPKAYPAIVALADHSCVVVHEVKEGDALVWRPATSATQWEPIADLSSAFTGWFATVFGDPTAIRQEGQPWEDQAKSHWFWSEIYKMRHRFRPVLVATFIVNILALALPLFSMNVYDRVLPNRAEATLWVLSIGVALAFGLDYALRRARSAVVDELGKELDLKLSQKIFAKILATPLASRRGHTGNLSARVSEYAQVRDFFASTTVVLIVDLAFLALFLLLIAYLAGLLVIVPIAAIVIMAMAGIRLQKQIVSVAREAQADHGLQQTLLVESIAGMETLKSLSCEGLMLGRWRQLSELGSSSQQRLREVSSAAIGLAATCQQGCNVALIVGGYYLFDAGKITMGAIIAIVMLSSRSLAPAAQLAYLLTRGEQAQQTLNSIQMLWLSEDERRMGSATIVPTVRSAHVRLDGVEFRYTDSQEPALSDLNIEIQPGDRVALIGRVASGKSTLGRVLCGLYQPTEGSVLVDGIDSRQYRPQDLRRAFCFVGQDAALFSGSLRDNLALGAGGASDEELIAAMKAIGADQFLSRDSGGFDRSVGEAGLKLSGGQRSFLTIARAFVSPSKLIFLDEPTGAMDSRTEQLFVESLSRSLTSEQTLVISTHRPALFSVCNRIIVLDKGRVVADGPRDTVLANAASGIGT